MDNERQDDTQDQFGDESPRDTASSGYPEEEPAGASTGEDAGGEDDRSGKDMGRGPEGSPGQATGNPGAAG